MQDVVGYAAMPRGDNGGVLKRSRNEVRDYSQPAPSAARREESDLVCPRPASGREVEAQSADNGRARQELQQTAELRAEAAAEEAENERLARGSQILESDRSRGTETRLVKRRRNMSKPV